MDNQQSHSQPNYILLGHALKGITHDSKSEGYSELLVKKHLQNICILAVAATAPHQHGQ
jgi:hypothetical protein